MSKKPAANCPHTSSGNASESGESENAPLSMDCLKRKFSADSTTRLAWLLIMRQRLKTITDAGSGGQRINMAFWDQRLCPGWQGYVS
ncbi:hypothetical protein TrVGV298_004197 [Trichoderma virens]|nr:hypothetical protein TrVGV298_004197 [Trichoderma virens]